MPLLATGAARGEKNVGQKVRGAPLGSGLEAKLRSHAREEERSRLTLEALDDVTSGQVIDHQAVQAWADSLSTDNPLPVPR